MSADIGELNPLDRRYSAGHGGLADACIEPECRCSGQQLGALHVASDPSVQPRPDRDAVIDRAVDVLLDPNCTADRRKLAETALKDNSAYATKVLPLPPLDVALFFDLSLKFNPLTELFDQV